MENLKLDIIDKVFSNMHLFERLFKLSNLYTDDFTYNSPMRDGISFEEHCHHLSTLCSYGMQELGKIECNGDRCICYISLVIIDPIERLDEKFEAQIIFDFRNNLIEKLTLQYEPNPIFLDYIKRNIKPTVE